MKENLSIEEKKKKTIDYFKKLGINLSQELLNAVSDVFDENDDIDNVDFYLKEDIEEFSTDMTLINEVNINLDGSCSGCANDVYTYYGSDNMIISLSEFTKLYDGDMLIKGDITQQDNLDRPTKIENPDDFIITLLEKTEFEKKKEEEKGTVNIIRSLRIYCPISGE